ncbi:MAG: HAD family hydrolase [Chloroflexota bacterium]
MEDSGKRSIDPARYRAAILDMDGVITRSARTHLGAWKQLFDDYLRERCERTGEEFHPFTEEDYYRYVDGKPRYEGAESFLQSRGINLPFGGIEDPPEQETVSGLGNRKNRYFLSHLKEHGVDAYESTKGFILRFKRTGGLVAAISSSRNARAVLDAAGVTDLFDAIVDGVDSARLSLKGKPYPDIFLEATRQLGVRPAESVVVEDAIAGVEAGKAGGFGLVIGVDRQGNNVGLKEGGADIVVRDLSDLM